MYNKDEYRELFKSKKSKTAADYNYDINNISIDGKICAFTGYRPQKLPFKNESDTACLKLRATIHDEIESAINLGYKNFISGMALGVDIWAAIEVVNLQKKYPEIKLYAAIPYLDQPSKWYSWQKDIYFELLNFCEDIFVISRIFSISSPNVRNAMMIKNANRLIAVYDGQAGGTANTVKMAQKKGIKIIIINPLDFTDTNPQLPLIKY